MSAWRAWLGATGRPLALDGWLARHLRGEEDRGPVFAALAAGCAWGAAALCAAADAPAARARELVGVDLLASLRRAEPASLLDLAAAFADLPAPRWARRAAGRAIADLEADGSPEARCARWGVPPSFAPFLARRVGRGFDADRWLGLQGTRPPLWLRSRAEVSEVEGSLRSEGFAVAVDGRALRVEGRLDIRATEAWRSGRVEVQDIGSQRAGGALEVFPGQQVWDVCAGRGGKTMQLADALAGRGAVHATDVDAHKLAALRVRARRAGVADLVRIRAWDGVSVLGLGREVERRGGVHAALVDAPCSATGTWRRNPDARLRWSPSAAPDLAALQRRLLALGAAAVRPGGRLAYVTCSWLVEEDEDAVDRFLDEHPGWACARAGLVGAPDEDGDTLFVAVLART